MEKKEKERPKRYNMYDQMNINEKWLDLFIVVMIVVLGVILITGII